MIPTMEALIIQVHKKKTIKIELLVGKHPTKNGSVNYVGFGFNNLRSHILYYQYKSS